MRSNDPNAAGEVHPDIARKYRVQSHQHLRKQMKAVARGHEPAPLEAADESVVKAGLLPSMPAREIDKFGL